MDYMSHCPLNNQLEFVYKLSWPSVSWNRPYILWSMLPGVYMPCSLMMNPALDEIVNTLSPKYQAIEQLAWEDIFGQ